MAKVTLATAMILAAAPAARAAITWDAEAGTNWWFNPVNWNVSSNVNNLLPPNGGSGTDTQINVGWNTAGEGVVFDPANDPHFAAAASLSYPADRGRQSIDQLYVSRNTTNSNLLTIKGDLKFNNTVIIGRSGTTVTTGPQNLGVVRQMSGKVEVPLSNFDIGQRETSGWGNGVYDYQGGTLEINEIGSSNLRLSHGSTSTGVGPGGHGRLIIRNPATPGHIRAYNVQVASYAGDSGGTVTALDPDGITTGVGILEFHFSNGSTRPLQIFNSLSINNGMDDATAGTRSARLEFILDGAPTIDGGGIPQNLGLIDLDYDNDGAGSVTGRGNIDGNATPNQSTDQVFSNFNATSIYSEGSTVSAIFGNRQYNWSITYTGNIKWGANPGDGDNSILDPVDGLTGAGTGKDIVLMGLSSSLIAVSDADFDNSGRVDGGDFLTWQRAVGGPGTSTTGDANGDSTVNADDYTIWKNQFGNPFPASAASSGVPEPGAFAMAGILAVALVGARRRCAGCLVGAS